MNIRIMWSRRSERREAVKTAKAIVKLLERMGYSVSVSTVYPNRRNNGGRIYIRASLGRKAEGGKVRAR